MKKTVFDRGKRWKGKTYFMAGTAESESMVPDMLTVFTALDGVSKARMQSVIRSGAGHNEGTWRAEFPKFWRWIVTP